MEEKEEEKKEESGEKVDVHSKYKISGKVLTQDEIDSIVNSYNKDKE